MMCTFICKTRQENIYGSFGYYIEIIHLLIGSLGFIEKNWLSAQSNYTPGISSVNTNGKFIIKTNLTDSFAFVECTL